MADIRFEWDARKNAQNQRKHGVSFQEAQTVFFDEFGLLIADPSASEEEERLILMGLSAAARMLVVCHCVRYEGDVIRIISARTANRSERRDYTSRLSR